MTRPDGQLCPFHPDQFARPVYVGSETADYKFTCPQQDHAVAGPFTWTSVQGPVGGSGDSLGLGLDIKLPKAVSTAAKKFGKSWVEFGLVEWAYATANPADWSMLLARYDHTYYYPASPPAKLPYTASKYLARSLGALSRQTKLRYQDGPGTGRWDYNSTISYYSMPKKADWSSQATWESSELDMDSYMPAKRPKA